MGTCPNVGVGGGGGATSDASFLPLGIKIYIVAINNGGGKAVPCDSACFQMAWRVSPSLLHRRVGLASPSLPTHLARCLHICRSVARCSLSVSQSGNQTTRCEKLITRGWIYVFLCRRLGGGGGGVELTFWSSFLWSSGSPRCLVASGRPSNLGTASMSWKQEANESWTPPPPC